MIRALQADDMPRCRAIYLVGIASGNASFQEPESLTLEVFAEKIALDKALVLEDAGKVVGLAWYTPSFSRCVYSGVGEVSVYIDPKAAGRGHGRALLSALVEHSEQRGFWSLHALIFPENRTSMYVHEKCGFVLLGVRKKLGKMTYGAHKGWRDVAFLERRSLLYQD